jgi:hypothetical protein
MIYTGSGLQRVKPYVQFGIGIIWREICPRGGSRRRGDPALEGRPRPPYIGWRALGYKSVSIYPSWLQQGNFI